MSHTVIHSKLRRRHLSMAQKETLAILVTCAGLGTLVFAVFGSLFWFAFLLGSK